MNTRSARAQGTAGSVAPPRPPEKPKKVSRRGRILVLDDQGHIVRTPVRTLVRTLEREHDAVAATAANEALALITAGETFDAIFGVAMTPETTGMDLYGALAREAPALADRMIVPTDGALTASAATFLAASRKGLLEKPFSPSQLREEVQRLSRHGPPLVDVP